MRVPVHIVESMGTLTKIQDWVPANNWLVVFFLTAQSNVCFLVILCLVARLINALYYSFIFLSKTVIYFSQLCFRCIYILEE